MPRLKSPVKRSTTRSAAPPASWSQSMMLVLIGAGAMAVDTGQIYAERAQLQNAADAGAMAAAQQCHKAGGCTVAQAKLWAEELSGRELQRRRHHCGFRGPVRSKPGQGRHFHPQRQQRLPYQDVRQRAECTAGDGPAPPPRPRWTPPSGGSGFPLAISNHCYNLSGAVATGDVQKIAYKPGGTCTGPSGTQIPGGWGWLDQSSPCVATTANRRQQHGLGPRQQPADAAAPRSWTAGRARSWQGGAVNVAFPIFDNATNQGQNGAFHIIGYATFKIWGWKFGNNHSYEFRNTAGDPGMTADLACDAGNDRCIIGQFVKFETIDSVGGSGDRHRSRNRSDQIIQISNF